MQKHFYAKTFLLWSSILIIVSCQKAQLPPTNEIAEYNLVLKKEVKKIGIAHNIALKHAEIFLAKTKHISQNNIDPYHDVETIVDATSQNLVDQGYSMEGVSLNQVKTTLYEAIIDSSYSLPNERVWTPIKESPAYQTSIVQKEKDFVDKVWSVFEKDYTNYSAEGCYQEMRTQLRILADEFESTTWSIGTGDYCGGLIYTTCASLDYWWDFYNRIDLASTEIVSNGVISSISKWLRRATAPQCDAAGYIVGWADSWLVDEEENANVRIKRGLVSAAGWSGFSLK